MRCGADMAVPDHANAVLGQYRCHTEGLRVVECDHVTGIELVGKPYGLRFQHRPILVRLIGVEMIGGAAAVQEMVNALGQCEELRIAGDHRPPDRNAVRLLHSHQM